MLWIRNWKARLKLSKVPSSDTTRNTNGKSRRTKDPSRRCLDYRHPPNTSIVSLTSPFTRRSLRTIQDAFSAAYTTKYFINPAETYATVLVLVCNPDGNPSLLLEVQGKLRAHSGEVRCALSCSSLVNFHLSWSRFPGGMSTRPMRVFRQPGQPRTIAEGPAVAGKPQNALQITPLRSTPTELTSAAMTVPE